MNDSRVSRGIDTEPMIDARQAAAALRLPYYWFADQAMRSRYRIPHYLLGGLVRYRLDELTVWAVHAQALAARTSTANELVAEGSNGQPAGDGE
jgi:hypothetical protein